MTQIRAMRIFLLAATCTGCSLMDGPSTGEVRISVNTLGAVADRDPNGYTLRDEEAKTYPLPVIGLVRIPDVPRGNHVYTLEGLAENCTAAGGNSIAVEVSGDLSLPTNVGLSVTCAPRTGTIVVTTLTSGSDQDPDGYFVTVANAAASSIAANGSLTVAEVREGQQTVRLSGIATNCTVTSGNPRQVNVTYAAAAYVDFTIDCTAAGSVRIVTVTTGEAVDTNGYLMELRFIGFPSTVRSAPTSSGEATFTGVPPGSYLLSVFGLAANCDPVVPSPRTVAVTQGSVSRVDVAISCIAPEMLALVTESSSTNLDISTIRSNGTGFAQLTSDLRADVDPSFSPDRTRIAFASERDGNFEIYSMDLGGTNLVRLTSNLANDRNPSWSPDGTRIVFESDRGGNTEIYVMNADGTNQVRLTDNTNGDVDPAWSPDGSRIAFASDRGGLFSIFVMRPDGSEVTRLTTAFVADLRPAWSPDGARIAFSSSVLQSRSAIHIVNSDGSARVSVTGELDDPSAAAWSPSGGKIAFSARVCDFYYYYNYCFRSVRVVDVKGAEYWSVITSRPVRDIAWR